MSERENHTFDYQAGEIAQAASARADYHEDRMKYWQERYDQGVLRIKETAKIVFGEAQVTGGAMFSARVEYGDPEAYDDVQLVMSKIKSHRAEVERLRSDAKMYQSQAGRIYPLDAEDVHHFGLSDEKVDD